MADEEAARANAELHNHIEAVWEHYGYTEHPNTLATYLELGGKSIKTYPRKSSND